MKYWKAFKRWLGCGLLTVLGLTFPAVSGWAKTLDRIIAKVNENIITLSELEERAMVKMMGLQKMNVQPLPSKEEVIHEELERMIEEKLLIDAGKKLNLKVNEESVTQAIDEIKRTNGLNDGDLEKMLQAESKTMEEYKGKIRDQILVSRVVGFEVRKRVTVSEQEIEEYYSRHLKDYWQPEKLRLRHILFIMDDMLLEEEKRIKRQKAKLALKKIRSGEDFAAVAKEFSEDISASTGGELGEIERGKMVPEFEKAAFRLKEGEVSGLVETPYGLHIIKVDKVIPGTTQPLDAVKAQIEKRLMDQKMKVEFQAYLSELKANAFIENKMPPLSRAAADKHQGPAMEKAVQSAVQRQNELADIPAPRPGRHTSPQLEPDQQFSRFQNFEEKLRYYKELRRNQKISEGEYQNKKRELLNQF